MKRGAEKAAAVNNATAIEKQWNENHGWMYGRALLRSKRSSRDRVPPPVGATWETLCGSPAKPSAYIESMRLGDGPGSDTWCGMSWRDDTHGDDRGNGGSLQWLRQDKAFLPNDYHCVAFKWPDGASKQISSCLTDYDPITESLAFVYPGKQGVVGIAGKDGTVQVMVAHDTSSRDRPIPFGSKNWLLLWNDDREDSVLVHLPKRRVVKCSLLPSGVEVVSETDGTLVLRGSQRSVCDRVVKFVQLTCGKESEPRVQVVFTVPLTEPDQRAPVSFLAPNGTALVCEPGDTWTQEPDYIWIVERGRAPRQVVLLPFLELDHFRVTGLIGRGNKALIFGRTDHPRDEYETNFFALVINFPRAGPRTAESFEVTAYSWKQLICVPCAYDARFTIKRAGGEVETYRLDEEE